MLPGKLLKSEPLKVHFLHYGARKRSFLTEPYMLYFPAFYSTFSRQIAKSNRALFKSV